MFFKKKLTTILSIIPKNLILEHYTFLNRPVIVIDNEVFVGNAAKTVASAKLAMERL
ncbi:arsenate reductase family protein [Capnocytophaga canimorsus]|uniref:arsenate reductase family protein n=1 Tax=Capnocytophaga canimorsus TaxID=28188 RepID=UPI00385871E7